MLLSFYAFGTLMVPWLDSMRQIVYCMTWHNVFLGSQRALEYIYSLLADEKTLTPQMVVNTERLWQQEIIDALQKETFRRLDDLGARRLLEGLAIYGQPVPSVALSLCSST